MQITRSSIETTPGPSDWFTGAVYVDAVAAPSNGSRLSASSVHFTPGARTAWHTHPNGQTIWVTEGVGLCQRRGGPIELIRPGDRVFFEPNEDHWHGAAPDRFMTHLAMLEVDDEGNPAIWGDHVTDQEYAAATSRVETVPDAHLIEPTDALVTVTRAAICGSDLWPYKSMEHDETGRRMGHEFVGIVEAVGPDVRTLDAGDMVVTPFVWSDGTCAFCQEGLHTSCLHGGRYGWDGVDGGQGEAVRVPQADGTLVVLPVDEDDAMMPSLLTLSDVMATGHHAAVSAEVGPGKTVAVVGDGAVGLCGVIAARRLGAERIILLGHHPDRIALARDFGATDVVSERGDEAVERVREFTDGFGAHSVLECVGLEQATVTALRIVRPGGAVGRVGVPQEESIPADRAARTCDLD